MEKSSEAPVTVGPAALEDLPAVVELCMQVEAQHEAYWPLRWKMRPGIREGYLRWMTGRLNEPRMLILAAKAQHAQPLAGFSHDTGRGPQVVGALLAAIETEIPIYTHKEYAFIHDMAVRADFRRRGIANRLLAAAHDWAQQRGMNQLRLMVAEQNKEGQIAFEHFGFRKTYREMVLPLNLEEQNK